MSVPALQRVVQNVVGHFLTRCLAIRASSSEMDTGKDAGFLDLLERRGEAAERPGHSQHHIGIHRERSVITKEVRQHGRSRATHGRMAGRMKHFKTTLRNGKMHRSNPLTCIHLNYKIFTHKSFYI